MLWNLRPEAPSAAPPDAPAEGRFVLQRHHDSGGPHLDLRLEQPGGFLLGWRIDAVDLDGDCAATEKSPHPLDWLDQDGDSQRVDAGGYRWLERDDHGGRLLLHGARGSTVVQVARGVAVSPAAVRTMCDTATRLGVSLDALANLAEDGVAARTRLVERLCGLGRELDGETFDEALWRDTLRGCSLAELQAHLRGYEVRFDAKYPPRPVSRPAPLDDAAEQHPAERALALLRG